VAAIRRRHGKFSRDGVEIELGDIRAGVTFADNAIIYPVHAGLYTLEPLALLPAQHPPAESFPGFTQERRIDAA
jgi:hypothetical protein